MDQLSRAFAPSSSRLLRTAVSSLPHTETHVPECIMVSKSSGSFEGKLLMVVTSTAAVVLVSLASYSRIKRIRRVDTKELRKKVCAAKFQLFGIPLLNESI